MHLKIALDRNDLEKLINGQIIKVEDYPISLSLDDIGLQIIATDVDRAIRARTCRGLMCIRCELPLDNIRGAYCLDGMDLCHRCIEDDEKPHAKQAR